jgi:preprotein translocase subunit Sec63
MVELLDQPVGVASDEVSKDPVQIDGDRIRERLRLAREVDYFELLGIERDASRAEIRRAHAEVARIFEASALEAETEGRHARELEELREALLEARDILLDDAMRSAYLAHVGEP